MPGTQWLGGRSHWRNVFPMDSRNVTGAVFTLSRSLKVKDTFFFHHISLLNDGCLQTAAVDKGGIGACLLKTTRTLKSDTISGVIYLQLSVPPLLEEQRTDVSLALMKKTTNRRWGSIVWGEVFDDDIAHRRVHMSRLRLREYFLEISAFACAWRRLYNRNGCVYCFSTNPQ